MKREDSGHRHTHEKTSMEAVRGAVAKALIPNSPQVNSTLSIAINLSRLKTFKKYTFLSKPNPHALRTPYLRHT